MTRFKSCGHDCVDSKIVLRFTACCSGTNTLLQFYNIDNSVFISATSGLAYSASYVLVYWYLLLSMLCLIVLPSSPSDGSALWYCMT